MTRNSTADHGTGKPAAGIAATPATYEDRVLGCLLGTMAGDAYGVLYAAGDDPVAALEDPAAVAVSDATQLTLYTVDALIEALEWANDGVAADETACLWLAYLRWLGRQGEHLPANAPAPPARWLDLQDDLLPVHDADADTVRALLTGEMGTQVRPLNRSAEGPGALMRSAPFGLVPRIPASMVERLTIEGAALTHGSPGARSTAALYSNAIRALAIDGSGLEDALVPEAGGKDHPVGAAGHDAVGALSNGAEAPRSPGVPAPTAGTGGATKEQEPSGGVTAAGTFEAASQAVREGVAESASPRGQLEAALAHAAAAGRPDASPVIAASLAGGILGALHGTSALPPAYLTAPGLPGVIRTVARTLLTATTGT